MALEIKGISEKAVPQGLVYTKIISLSLIRGSGRDATSCCFSKLLDGGANTCKKQWAYCRIQPSGTIFFR